MTAILTERQHALRHEQALEFVHDQWGEYGVAQADKLKSSLLVIKYGGGTLLRNTSKVVNNTALVEALDIPQVIAHGAGPQIDQILGVANISSPKINGWRKTSKSALHIVDRISRGVNRQLVDNLHKGGVKLATGIEAGVYEANIENEDLYGFVGSVLRVNTDLVLSTMQNEQKRHVPVISSLGHHDSAQAININADPAAAALAIALDARIFMPITDEQGILDRSGDIIRSINSSDDQVERLIEENVISGGMIPKSRGSRDVAHSTGGLVVITNVDSMLDVLFMPPDEFIGTRFSTAA